MTELLELVKQLVRVGFLFALMCAGIGVVWVAMIAQSPSVPFFG